MAEDTSAKRLIMAMCASCPKCEEGTLLPFFTNWGSRPPAEECADNFYKCTHCGYTFSAIQ